MAKHLPALIVVCGAPASGKTTLARRLATGLSLPLLEKDVIKESLAGSFETPDRDASRRIGAASFQLAYDLGFAVLERGTDVMIEANMTLPWAGAALERLAAVSRPLIVQCAADAAVIEARYRERAGHGERHAAHFDLDALPDLLAGLDDGRYDLTGLGHEVLTVDTASGYWPGYDAVRDAIRRHLRG